MDDWNDHDIYGPTYEQTFMQRATKVGFPPILWKNNVLRAQKVAV